MAINCLALLLVPPAECSSFSSFCLLKMRPDTISLMIHNDTGWATILADTAAVEKLLPLNPVRQDQSAHAAQMH